MPLCLILHHLFVNMEIICPSVVVYIRAPNKKYILKQLLCIDMFSTFDFSFAYILNDLIYKCLHLSVFLCRAYKMLLLKHAKGMRQIDKNAMIS